MSEPFIPFFLRDEEEFVDKVGNRAIITYIDYEDKKGKVFERIVRYVKWL